MKQLDQSAKAQDRQLVKAARAAVKRREEGIDRETLSRLGRARTAALGQLGSSALSAYRWLGLGAACAALVVLLLWPGAEDTPGEEPFIASDWLLYEEMDVEMIEDMEFYQWLAEELDGHSS
ncbi:hypothetical protein [Microbulbifer sp. GL-2]|uniref:hypothetical protein n=1 Tax=Microbulbifer sp. GL-2 TaxID=2591606 RepID=UPI00116524F5|nr:hypothetical protein [Microbulbifer sp. GL-2]BBM02688.1 hypothetical protein GL2_27620 [Microbulbifer sp. GL-2]